MDMRKLVGRNFGKLRREKGFTQEQFAEISGFTQQYVSDLERGRRNPTVVTLFHLADALGISHIDLVQPDDEARGERASRQSAKAEPGGPWFQIGLSCLLIEARGSCWYREPGRKARRAAGAQSASAADPGAGSAEKSQSRQCCKAPAAQPGWRLRGS
jgi:transcriptional regulator with XRE-family HTH domain